MDERCFAQLEKEISKGIIHNSSSEPTEEESSEWEEEGEKPLSQLQKWLGGGGLKRSSQNYL